MEKKERLKLTLPDAAQTDIAKIAAQKSLSVSALIRSLVLAFLTRETGKKYPAVKWGGKRPNAGRKPAKNRGAASRSPAKKSRGRSIPPPFDR